MDIAVDYYDLAGPALEAFGSVREYVEDESSLDSKLVELVKLRASHVNGCGHCVEVHSERLKDLGEEVHRLNSVSAWDETTHFTDREQAALAWTDAVTQISDGIPIEVERRAHEMFSEQELVDLTLVIGTINVYNRLAICFRDPILGDRPMQPR